jgi:hypothetical protein
MPITCLLRFLLLLAVLLAPVRMTSSHAAMAMPAPGAGQEAAGHELAPADGHCADMAPATHDEPAGDASPAADNHCTIACSCVPPAMGQIAAQAPSVMEAVRPAPPLLMSGLSPQAEPRPPKPA